MSGTTESGYPHDREELLSLVRESNRSKADISRLWRQQARSLNRFSRALEGFSATQSGQQLRSDQQSRMAQPSNSLLNNLLGRSSTASNRPVLVDDPKVDNLLGDINEETQRQSRTLDNIYRLMTNEDADRRTEKFGQSTVSDRISDSLKKVVELLRHIEAKAGGGLFGSGVPDIPGSGGGVLKKGAALLSKVIRNPVTAIGTAAVAGGIIATNQATKDADTGEKARRLGMKVGGVLETGQVTHYTDSAGKMQTPEDVEKLYAERVKADPSIDKPMPGSAKATSATPNAPSVPYTAGNILPKVGIDQAQYQSFKESVAGIESKGRYDIMGGSSGRFAGKYQMGADEIKETAQRLGVAAPSRQEFLSNPAMQEQFFEAYTAGHHDYLMKNPKYAQASPEEKLKILGYAHNQGAGGASKYLNTGQIGSDAFGTAGTKYMTAIGAGLNKLKTDGTAATAAAGTPGNASVAIGDSIAQGVGTAGGLTTNAKVGASPDAILKSIQAMPEDQIRGKNIVLSGGASNNPAQAKIVSDQIAALKAKGASNVNLMGVGDRSDMAGVNDQLAQIAKQSGANFTGGLSADNLSADRIHPKDYKSLASTVTQPSQVKQDTITPSSPAGQNQVAATRNTNLPNVQAQTQEGTTLIGSNAARRDVFAQNAAVNQNAPVSGFEMARDSADTAADTTRGAAVQPGYFMPPTPPAAPAETRAATVAQPSGGGGGGGGGNNADIDAIPMHISDNGIVYVNGGSLS